MIVRPIRILLATAIAASLIPAAARADGRSPFTVGVGTYVPTSPSSSLEGFAPAPGTSISQHGNISIDLSFGRDLIPGGYQISALVLSQKQTGSFLSLAGPVSAQETITQVPVMLESSGTEIGPVRFGGGLGYDFVSHGSFAGAPSPNVNGIVGDTFLEVGVGGGAAFEAKYFFGQRAALSGVFVGIKTRL